MRPARAGAGKVWLAPVRAGASPTYVMTALHAIELHFPPVLGLHAREEPRRREAFVEGYVLQRTAPLAGARTLACAAVPMRAAAFAISVLVSCPASALYLLRQVAGAPTRSGLADALMGAVGMPLARLAFLLLGLLLAIVLPPVATRATVKPGAGPC